MSRGLGYLKVETELRQTKRTAQVEAQPTDTLVHDQSTIRGYRIHMGVTVRTNEYPCFKLQRCLAPIEGDHPLTSMTEEECDGAIREDGLVWGTYIHGVFDEPRFRRAWINRARVRKGLPPLDYRVSRSVSSRLRGELDRWADHLFKNIDLSCLFR